jgi:O-methyltransferase
MGYGRDLARRMLGPSGVERYRLAAEGMAAFRLRCTLAAPFLPLRVKSRHLIADLRRHGFTMVSEHRLQKLADICSGQSLPPGAFVECGVAKGGCVALMSFLAHGTRRTVWGFDSFEGMPALTDQDESEGREWVGYQCSGPAGLATAQRTLARLGGSAGDTRLVPGWFEATLPVHVDAIGPIAVLRLDNDWYESTRFCLATLYDRVAPGGYVLIDDYFTFVGCRKAVDEFRRQHAIAGELVTLDTASEVFWQKA